MNVKRYIWAGFALFVFMYFYEWFVNGFALTSIYHRTPDLWRPLAEMKAKMPIWVLLQLILAFWLAFAFAQFCREGGVKKGLYFGLFIGVFAGILSGSAYFWLPVSGLLGWSWFISWLIEGVIGGIILGAIYRRQVRL